jgi:hypothetical protein
MGETTDLFRPRLTHAELVALAARWLHGTRKCCLVATERTAFKVFEYPDAIGWMPDGKSILVECKTSLSDFYADQRKASRRGLMDAMGRERWYLTEDGLLASRTLPDGWGWAVVRKGRIFRVTSSVPQESDAWLRAEMPLIVAIARRGATPAVTTLPDLEVPEAANG